MKHKNIIICLIACALIISAAIVIGFIILSSAIANQQFFSPAVLY